MDDLTNEISLLNILFGDLETYTINDVDYIC